jgi:outer membrane protein assembly factor BamB
MQRINRFTFLILIVFPSSFSVVYADTVHLFSLDWSYPTFYQISPHALDSFGQAVYFGEANPLGYTNYLYAVNITNGATIWRYNTSLPINYVSHFKSNNADYIAAGAGTLFGTQTEKSNVLAITPSSNKTFWKSINLVSPVTSLCSAESGNVSGSDDVVAGLENGTVIRLSGETGQILWKYDCISKGESPVFTVFDLKNGSIVAGCRETPGSGRIYCLQRNGTLRWNFFENNRTILVKKFGDVNRDGEPEVVMVFYDYKIRVLNGSDGEEFAPEWPLAIPPVTEGTETRNDTVKDLLCGEDYNEDGIPDIVYVTEYGRLAIVNGLNAQFLRTPVDTGYTVTSIQYLYSYENGIAYSNKTLAVSLYDSTPTYYVYGVNASDLTLMKQFPVPNNAQAINLFNVGNYTSTYTGDLVFTAYNLVYGISGADIIYPEFPSQIVLVIIIVAVWFLVAILRRERLRID